MLIFSKFDKTQTNILHEWLENDDAGMQYIPSYAKTEDFLHLIDFEKRHLWIVFNNGSEIGFFDLEIESNEKAYFVFYVAPQFRGNGLGKILMEEALKLPEVMQIKILEGGITKGNNASISTLEKVGFHYSYTDEDDMLMYQKVLK